MSSEASLLKDLISFEHQVKFSSQNLNELKISYHARGLQHSPHFRLSQSELQSGQTPGSGPSSSDTGETIAMQAMTMQNFGLSSGTAPFINSF